MKTKVISLEDLDADVAAFQTAPNDLDAPLPDDAVKIHPELVKELESLAGLEQYYTNLKEIQYTDDVAMEAHQLMPQAGILAAFYSPRSTGEKRTVALEGVVSGIWDHIKKMLAWLQEKVSKFIAMIKGWFSKDIAIEVKPEAVKEAKDVTARTEALVEAAIKELNKVPAGPNPDAPHRHVADNLDSAAQSAKETSDLMDKQIKEGEAFNQKMKAQHATMAAQSVRLNEQLDRLGKPGMIGKVDVRKEMADEKTKWAHSLHHHQLAFLTSDLAARSIREFGHVILVEGPRLLDDMGVWLKNPEAKFSALAATRSGSTSPAVGPAGPASFEKIKVVRDKLLKETRAASAANTPEAAISLMKGDGVAHIGMCMVRGLEAAMTVTGANVLARQIEKFGEQLEITIERANSAISEKQRLMTGSPEATAALEASKALVKELHNAKQHWMDLATILNNFTGQILTLQLFVKSARVYLRDLAKIPMAALQKAGLNMPELMKMDQELAYEIKAGMDILHGVN